MRRTFPGAIVSLALLVVAACTTVDTSPGGGNPVTINWSPCINSTDFPAWFAVQDGSGAWTKVSSANGVFTFTISSDRAGVARYANGQLTILYATSAELTGFKPSCTGSRRTVTGTVTGYGAADDIEIEMEQGSVSISGTTLAPASFQLTSVAPGASDVLAIRSQSSASSSTFQQTPSAVFIRRAQSTSPLTAIDLNSAVESGAPQLKTVTVSNVANNESLEAQSLLTTPTSTITMSDYLANLGTVTGNVAAVFYGLPSTRLQTGENQELEVIATKTLAASSSESRYVATTFTNVADNALTLLSALGTVTIAGTARPSASYVIQTGYDQTFEFDLDQGSGAAAKSIQVITTRGYAGATATAVTLLVPDLTGLSGFLPAWQLTTGTSATWTFIAGSYTIITTSAQSFTAGTRTATFTP
jgi:hypothetical protein